MRYLSLFSGLGAAEYALTDQLEWQCLARADIAPAADAVGQHHFPAVPNLGDVRGVDFTRYRGSCDVIIGGSPCQGFSAAGKRKGLADERSRLMYKFLEAFQDSGATCLVWENVANVLGDRGNAFGYFLGGFLQGDGPVEKPGNRWPRSGIAYRNSRYCAWRILEPSGWGVPARRARVWVVGIDSAGSPEYRALPAKVLLEPSSAPGDAQACWRKWYATTPRPPEGAGVYGFLAHRSGNGCSDALAPTIAAGNHANSRPGGTAPFAWAIKQSSISYLLRYATPVECERLMGLPDNWTAAPGLANYKRYWLIGNSFFAPIVRWIGARIEAELKAIHESSRSA